MKEYIQHIILLVFAFAGSIVLMTIALPQVIRISQKKKLFDFPDERRIHLYPIPRLGGVTFAPIIVIVLILTNLLGEAMHLLNVQTSETLMLIAGLSLIFMLGLNDDLGGVNFIEKLFIQFLAALFLTGNNTLIHNLNGLFGLHEIPYIASVTITILIVIFTTNAINLIDGIDGLASGIGAVALILYGILFYYAKLWVYVTICVSTIGVLIPFFYYNFCQKECKIFMGDTGSLTLGYMLSFLMIHLLNYQTKIDVVDNGFILLIMSGLFIPLSDALRVLISRILARKNPFSPDKNHIHHRILNAGSSNKQAVGLLLLISIILIAMNWSLLYFLDCNIVLSIDVVLAFIINQFIDSRKKLSTSNTK